VLIEAPLMLGISWFACGWLIGRFSVPPLPGSRLLMGTIAFVLLMIAELSVSVIGFGRSVFEHADRPGRSGRVRAVSGGADGPAANGMMGRKEFS
jgi:hypothetical protein